MSQADTLYIQDLEMRVEELEDAIAKALDMHDLDDVHALLEQVNS